MYAVRVACCPLANHVEYTPRILLRNERTYLRILLRLEKHQTDRHTDGRQTIT